MSAWSSSAHLWAELLDIRNQTDSVSDGGAWPRSCDCQAAITCPALLPHGNTPDKTTPPHQSARHPVDHDPLGQVHGVGDGQHDQPGVTPRRPVKQVVHHVLLPGPEQVQLEETGRDGGGVSQRIPPNQTRSQTEKKFKKSEFLDRFRSVCVRNTVAARTRDPRRLRSGLVMKVSPRPPAGRSSPSWAPGY